MIEKLKINAIYKDFLNNVHLTEEQIRILNMLLNKDTVLKISMEIGASDRTVNKEIKKIKKLYKDYYELQIFKAEILSK